MLQQILESKDEKLNEILSAGDDEQIIEHNISLQFLEKVNVSDIDKTATDEAREANTELVKSRIINLEEDILEFCKKINEKYNAALMVNIYKVSPFSAKIAMLGAILSELSKEFKEDQ